MPDGGCVFAGSFTGQAVFQGGSAPNVTLSTSGNADAYVARYLADGTLAWAKKAGGTGDESSRCVGVLSNGNIVVGGSFQSFITFAAGLPGSVSFTTAGDRDTFLAAYGNDGTFLWARQGVGPGRAFLNALSAAPDGTFVICGTFRDSLTIGQGEPNQTTLTSLGGPSDDDAFFGRLLPDGTTVHAAAMGTAGIDEAHATAVLGDGTVIVTGISGGHGFITRYSGTTSLVNIVFSGPAYEYVTEAAALPDGDFVVGGKFFESTTFHAGTPSATPVAGAGSRECFFLRVGPDGTLRWHVLITGTGVDLAEGLCTWPDGSIGFGASYYGSATVFPAVGTPIAVSGPTTNSSIVFGRLGAGGGFQP